MDNKNYESDQSSDSESESILESKSEEYRDILILIKQLLVTRDINKDFLIWNNVWYIDTISASDNCPISNIAIYHLLENYVSDILNIIPNSDDEYDNWNDQIIAVKKNDLQIEYYNLYKLCYEDKIRYNNELVKEIRLKVKDCDIIVRQGMGFTLDEIANRAKEEYNRYMHPYLDTYFLTYKLIPYITHINIDVQIEN